MVQTGQHTYEKRIFEGVIARDMNKDVALHQSNSERNGSRPVRHDVVGNQPVLGRYASEHDVQRITR